MNKGKLISFEGIEGVGKSTTINSIKKYLEEKNLEVYNTREPGGTKYGESLRKILLDNKSFISPEAELLLIFSMRNQHIEEVIKPKLSKGVWVLCDRYTDASVAYQGYGKKISINKIQHLIDQFTGDLAPDLTIFFDLPHNLAKKRFPKNKIKDRFENLDNNFFNDVYNGYIKEAAKHKDRIKIVDARASKEDVYGQIINIIDKKFYDII